jgi:hypothetical protein
MTKPSRITSLAKSFDASNRLAEDDDDKPKKPREDDDPEGDDEGDDDRKKRRKTKSKKRDSDDADDENRDEDEHALRSRSDDLHARERAVTAEADRLREELDATTSRLTAVETARRIAAVASRVRNERQGLEPGPAPFPKQTLTVEHFRNAQSGRSIWPRDYHPEPPSDREVAAMQERCRATAETPGIKPAVRDAALVGATRDGARAMLAAAAAILRAGKVRRSELDE